jgi:hypothetical protein
VIAKLRPSVVAGVVLVALLSGCGPFEAYRVRTETRLEDGKLTEGGQSVDLVPVALGAGFRAGGKATGEAVDNVKADWSDVSSRMDEALAEQSSPEFRLIQGGSASRYVLQPELVMATSVGDVWFGYTTDVGVLCTLWDRRAKRVVERFTVLATVPGEWRVAGADGAIAHAVGSYLAARLQGKELNTTVTP